MKTALNALAWVIIAVTTTVVTIIVGFYIYLIGWCFWIKLRDIANWDWAGFGKVVLLMPIVLAVVASILFTVRWAFSRAMPDFVGEFRGTGTREAAEAGREAE